ncbi:hypothetical protein SAMN04487859_12130 [Roseovarius lutimaris]|uniref:Uncharacterized protein n=1 Tax=Roseovarius lutimaris TaxID=1005928 RepID=A0A1I5FPV1_9RHOB|nr:hypothetical protein SAMN04487859_12130 [Roseovarius lutimaris]
MDFRSITREEHEDARQVARDIAKTKQYDFYFANVRHYRFARTGKIRIIIVMLNRSIVLTFLNATD